MSITASRRRHRHPLAPSRPGPRGVVLAVCGLTLIACLNTASVGIADVAADTVSEGAESASETAAVPSPSRTPVGDPDSDELAVEEPWDYSPYRVQIWLSSDDVRVSAETIDQPLRDYLDRDFSALWRLSVADAPTSIRIAAGRDLSALTYDRVTAADPVIAVKRNHPEAPRIRFASDVGTYVKDCLSTADRIDDVIARGTATGNPDLSGSAKTFRPLAGDALMVVEAWEDEQTEALLLNRGLAKELRDPEAKIISLPIDRLVSDTIEHHDKLFVVHVETAEIPWTLSVVELDCLMRHFSIAHRFEVARPERLPEAIGRAVTAVFAPTIRIEDAGQKTADGLVRAAGLITAETSPAKVEPGDFFVPMIRKNDRNGDPIGVGPLDWAYLHVKEIAGARLKLDYHAGKAGGLQGRRNKRLFRTATRVRPFLDETTVRLHAQRDPSTPLVGYEIYERQLDSPEMTFVGRTDWDGRIPIEKTDTTMRLLYVKNGGAVLARLPVVPGQSELEVADLVGDDQRLRAEAYIKGVQNSILDLVAIRQLFAARVRNRIEKGELDQAKELLESLRKEPSYEQIADDMGRKLTQVRGRNAAEQMKIDQMFAQTREMLVKNINPQIVRNVEEAVMAAEKSAAPPPAEAADAAADEGNGETAAQDQESETTSEPPDSVVAEDTAN